MTAQQTLLNAVLDSESIDTSTLTPRDIVRAVNRVAIFTEAFLPKVDGVSRTALLTIKYLESTARELIVFAPAPAPRQISHTPIYAIPSLWMPFYAETRVAPPWPFILPRLRAFQPDMLHLFSPFCLGFMGMLAGEWLNVPVIANYQTDLPAYAQSYGYGYFSAAVRDLLRYIHNGCHRTLVPSRATMHELRSWGFRRLRLWERGVDVQRFTPARRSTAWRERLLAGRDDRRLLVLYVGRMAREKHLETLREIAREPGIALTLVGGGNYQPTIQRLLADTDTYFTGYLIGDDLANAFAAADVFVFPGPTETFGQVVLEAMASGLPVVVSDRGGPQTLIVDGVSGCVCPMGDASAFADRVRCLRDDPALRQHMGQAARRAAEQRPWITIMKQLEGYYAEALRLHQRRHALNCDG
ncbi:MAG: glycosyltransferase family 1 protein [Anaerolineae bacterium]|nr:glycosyltransferase family 1 protein [Anaerolineae bacterium]